MLDLQLQDTGGTLMSCPRCKCPECAKVELNAVLARRIVARETIPQASDAEIRKAFGLLPNYRPPVSNTVAEMEGR